MSFFPLLLAAVVVLMLCSLAMAVGVIFRNKTFTSCGCSSITFRGEKIRCAACPEKGDEEAVTETCGEAG